MHVRSAGLFQWDDEDYNAATLSEFPRAVFDCLENAPTPTGKNFPLKRWRRQAGISGNLLCVEDTQEIPRPPRLAAGAD
jgi:hypothetical protein